GRRRALEPLVSARRCATRATRVVRAALLDGRGRLHLLPRADTADGRGPRRPAAPRGTGRRLPRVPRCARAAPRHREARRTPLPDAAVRRLEALLARLPRVGARAGRRRRVPVRATPPLVVRPRDPRRAAALARGTADVVGRRGRTEDRRRERAG